MNTQKTDTYLVTVHRTSPRNCEFDRALRLVLNGDRDVLQYNLGHDSITVLVFNNPHRVREVLEQLVGEGCES